MFDHRKDAIVIGGGIVGVCIARSLAQRDLDVALYESGQIGEGSTGRSVGGVRQQFSDELRARLAIASRKQFERYANQSEEINIQQNGYLFLARTEAQAESFRTDQQLHRSLGLETELREPETLPSLVPDLRTEDLVLGKYCPTDFVTDPSHLTTWLSEQAQKEGVEIKDHCPVTDLLVENGEITGAATKSDQIASDRVIVAAGVWSNRLLDPVDSAVPITPQRIQVVTTAETDHDFATQPFVVDISRRMYFRPWGEHALLIGGRNENEEGAADIDSYNQTEDPAFHDQATHFLQERTQSLDDIPTREGWAGLKGVTPDGNPYVGESEYVDELYMATGFNGHGFMLAPAIAAALGNFICENDWGDIDLSLFTPTPDRVDDTAFEVDHEVSDFMGASGGDDKEHDGDD